MCSTVTCGMNFFFFKKYAYFFKWSSYTHLWSGDLPNVTNVGGGGGKVAVCQSRGKIHWEEKGKTTSPLFPDQENSGCTPHRLTYPRFTGF